MENLTEEKRKKRYFNKLLLVVFLSAILYFGGYVFFSKRHSRYYYLPKGFYGWVTVKYEKPGAPELDYKNGAYQIYVPVSGIVETSTKLESGWGRDEHYWWDGKTAELIPKRVDTAGQKMKRIHEITYETMDYSIILANLPASTDTLLWEGSRIRKRGMMTDIKTGRKILEHFWVAPRLEPMFHAHDSLPKERKTW